MGQLFNSIALRKAKIVCNFGLSECSRVKENIFSCSSEFKAANRKSQKLFPFVKMTEKAGTVALHLKSEVSALIFVSCFII